MKKNKHKNHNSLFLPCRPASPRGEQAGVIHNSALFGQSIVEIIIAVAMFVIIAGSAVVAVLGSLSTSRLAEEETQATMIMTEGLEAVQSIKNKDWENLVDGDYGLTSTGDAWAFSGTSDVDPSSKFTRSINIASVERDGNDDIIVSGGTVDPDTKKIISSVTWDFTPARTNTIEVMSYVTNWQEAVGGEAVSYSTCFEFCIGNGYSDGTCRRNSAACNSNGETYEAEGDQYCTGGGSVDTCCCLP